MITQIKDQKEELDYYKNLAIVASKSGTNNMPIETIMNIMLTARDLGISPFKALNGGFYIVNGKISMSTALMADRIRKEGHSIQIPEWTNKKCVIVGMRKDNGDSVQFEYTIEDALCAGLTSSPVWKRFPKQMLYNRAMSTLARTLFPDVVGNAYSEDEKWDLMNIAPEKRPDEDPDVLSYEKNPVIVPEEIDEECKLNILQESLVNDGLSIDNLKNYLDHLCTSKKVTMNKVLDSALEPSLRNRFKEAYSKHLETFTQISA